MLLVTAGAREKSLVFPGNTLPGVYGAGAFQTLVNRDLVRPTERLFIVGGGNVGLIAGYHALQAGIEVVGLCEALPECGGYKVHKDKLVRMGVPIYTSHTVLSAERQRTRSSRSPSREIDKTWQPDPRHREDASPATRCSSRSASTRWTSSCTRPASSACRRSPPATPRRSPRPRRPCSPAGSAASRSPAPSAATSARSRPSGTARPRSSSRAPARRSPRTCPEERPGVFPVFHCAQEIPCNPCTSVCPQRRHPHRGRRHPGPARVRRATQCDGLREVRRHLPRPRHHAGRLPQGPASSRPSPSPTSSRRSGSRRATRSPCSTPRARCSATSR